MSLHLPDCVHVHRHRDAATLADTLAPIIADDLRRAIAKRGRASLLLPGGSSPLALFAALSRQPLDWAAVTVVPGDERCVPINHADSNAGQLRQRLLRDQAASALLLPLWDATAADPVSAAEQALARLVRPFDVVVLGMGEDGHFASLFPGAAGTAEALDPKQPAPLVMIQPPVALHRRISLTVSALTDTRHLVLIASGAAKLAVLERAATGPDPALPISVLLACTPTPLDLHLA